MRKYILLFIFICFGVIQANSQCWKILESGGNHTVAIHQNGTLWAWGANFNGEVGDGTTNNSNVPKLISSATNWVAISAGHSHNLAIKADGTLWSWGYDVFNALGLGALTQINIPTQVGSANNWVYISAGNSFSFAIKSNGTLWGWGLNLNGEIGDGTITPKTIPTQVGTHTDWAKVFTGNNFTAAIKTNKTLWTWGSYNNHGELGNGTYSSYFVPTQVGTGSNWQSVSTEQNFGLGLKTDGTIWGWGDNSFGQLGLGTGTTFLSPTQIGTNSDWKQVEAGYDRSFFIKNNATLWGIGNAFLGNGTTVSSSFLIQIGTGVNWSTVSSQLFQTIGLHSTNIGYGWGSNYFGQIGNGYTDTGLNPDPNDYSLPVQINCPCIVQLIPTFSLPSNLCTGNSVPLLPTTSNNGIVGTWSPSLISNSSSGTYVFTPDVLLFPCASVKSLSVTVSAIETPTFNTIPTTYCQYEVPPTLPTNSTNTVPLVGVWNPSAIDTNVVGSSTYTFIPNAGQCVSSTPFNLVVTINPSVFSDFTPIMPFCVGATAPILSNTAPNGVVGTWSPSLVSNTNSGSYEFTPNASGCVAKQVLQINVLPAVTPDFQNLTICKGDNSIILANVSPNGIVGTWSPAVINSSVNGNYVFTPNLYQCATNQTISVSVQESLIDSVDYTVSNNFSENSILSILVMPLGNYLYQLDNGTFQQNSIFENVTSGLHSVSIIDVDGCNAITKIEGIRIINYPKYFTPNNDGYHDYWNIYGMDGTYNATITIYDRFGKVLKQFNQQNAGWDGTYNGQMMPSTDYWFKIEYLENTISKQFSSHFSLLR